MEKHEKSQRRFAFAILLITLVELVGLIVNAIVMYPDGLFNNLALAFQCLIMIILIPIPLYFEKIFKIAIPRIIYILFITLCFCGLVLGDVSEYYEKYAYWDDILHFAAGMLLAITGFTFVNTLCSSKSGKISLSPFVFSLVAFCFAMTGQAMWEICEFTCDEFFGTNAQTFLQTSTGSFVGPDDIPLVGHEALTDTMLDFILAFVGGLLVSVVGYFDLKRGKKKGVFTETFEREDDTGDDAKANK